MPKTTVYIRKEDWAKWQALKNKSGAISAMLNKTESRPLTSREVTICQHEVDKDFCALCS